MHVKVNQPLHTLVLSSLIQSNATVLPLLLFFRFGDTVREVIIKPYLYYRGVLVGGGVVLKSTVWKCVSNMPLSCV